MTASPLKPGHVSAMDYIRRFTSIPGWQYIAILILHIVISVIARGFGVANRALWIGYYHNNYGIFLSVLRGAVGSAYLAFRFWGLAAVLLLSAQQGEYKFSVVISCLSNAKRYFWRVAVIYLAFGVVVPLAIMIPLIRYGPNEGVQLVNLVVTLISGSAILLFSRPVMLEGLGLVESIRSFWVSFRGKAGVAVAVAVVLTMATMLFQIIASVLVALKLSVVYGSVIWRYSALLWGHGITPFIEVYATRLYWDLKGIRT